MQSLVNRLWIWSLAIRNLNVYQSQNSRIPIKLKVLNEILRNSWTMVTGHFKRIYSALPIVQSWTFRSEHLYWRVLCSLKSLAQYFPDSRILEYVKLPEDFHNILLSALKDSKAWVAIRVTFIKGTMLFTLTYSSSTWTIVLAYPTITRLQYKHQQV